MMQESKIKIILSFFCMVFLVYITSTLFRGIKLDLSEERLYTLSEGTISILSKLDSPIKLKLYYSKTAANKGTEGLRVFNNHYRYIRELLSEYARNSRNNLIIETIDPRPDTPEEEDAMAYGLKQFNLTETERYFFGLVAENESGAERIIEFFDPNRKDKLEYDLTKLIYTALGPEKKNVGIISSLEVMSEYANPYMEQLMRLQGRNVKSSWVITKMMQEFYNLKLIKRDAKSISGIDLLVIIHPTDFSEETLMAIDQYLLKGHNLLVFVDPNTVTARNNLGGIQRPSSSPGPGFKKLMDKWGIDIDPQSYAGDRYLSGVGRFGPNAAPSRMLALLNCNELCTDPHKDPVTSGINNAIFVFPGVLTSKEIDGVTHTPIMSTTPKGNSYTAAPYELNNPQILWRNFKEGTKPVILAYKVSGKYKTAFPDASKKNKDFLQESLQESAIIVFSDVDFINDRFAFQNTFLGPSVANGNSTLVLNAIESLSGNVALMNIRSKGRVNRSFDVVNQIEVEAEKKTADKVNEINANIARFQNELNNLGRQAHAGNISLIQNEGIRKKKELVKRIAKLKKELRSVKREGREKIERMGKLFQYLNTLLIPLLVVAIGIYYNRKRTRLTQGR